MQPVDIQGVAAIQLIMQNVAPDLARQWDGSLERVAFVLEVPQGARIGFFSNRGAAINALRRRGLVIADSLEAVVRACADNWEKQGPASGVECVLIGWTTCQVLEIDPTDLRAAKEMPTPVGLSQAAGRIVVQAETQAGALELVRGMRTALRQHAVDPSEFEALERAIADSWHDAAALSLATARAASALEQTNDPALNEARFVLMLMADTFGNRAALVTGGGGDA
jgi:hypothetical protein